MGAPAISNKSMVNFASTLLTAILITYAQPVYAAPPGQPTQLSLQRHFHALTKFAHVESRLSGHKRQRGVVFYAPINLCDRRACSTSDVVGLFPSGTVTDTTPTYIWRSVSTALWYYLWVDDSTSNKIQQWYSATEAGCASGTGTCSVIPSTVLALGSGRWWVIAWNADGYGPWSSGMFFTVRFDSGPTFQWPAGSSPADITQGYAAYNRVVPQ
jgi:hypothetical protein